MVKSALESSFSAKRSDGRLAMTTMQSAYISGVFEHSTRNAPDKSTIQLHAEVAHGALADAGLQHADVDGYFCAGDALGFGGLSITDYLGLNHLRHIDTTEIGGSSYLSHVAHAAQAIRLGKCRVALVTMAGRPRQNGVTPPPAIMQSKDGLSDCSAEQTYESVYGATTLAMAAMCARRHMHEFGTTSQQLAWIKVAASHHAQWNPNAMLKSVLTVDDVLGSPLVADPLHRMDCCVVSDGGGAIVLAAPDVAKDLAQPQIAIKGDGEAIGGPMGGIFDLTVSAAASSGHQAFAEAGVTADDIKYASIYDSFTIAVLIALEDLGFCAKGDGGAFVEDGGLIANAGRLAVNTDGGGLCNNHPQNRGGITKIIEAVRQLRGHAHPKVQVPNCDLALVHGTGGILGARHGCATLILEREA